MVMVLELVFKLMYFSPAYDPKVHRRIVELLEAIKARHGIPWEEIVVYPAEWYGKRLMMRAEEVYEEYLKPSTNLIKTSSEILRSLGFDVIPETAARKFGSRRGLIRVAGTVALAFGDVVVWASPFEKEVLQFLKKLYEEGQSLLNKLVPDPLELMRKRHRLDRAASVRERHVLREAALELDSRGYDVFVNVRHNMLAGEDPAYMFTPDADIIAIKGSRIVGIEVKGARGEEPSLDQIYVGLGEAIFYLINPIHFVYRGAKLDGGIFDEVYLLLPKLPRDLESRIVRIFRDLRIVGLTTLEQGLIVEPEPNPYLNEEKKRVLLRNARVLERYRLRYGFV